jgi:hypothetical protein
MSLVLALLFLDARFVHLPHVKLQFSFMYFPRPLRLLFAAYLQYAALVLHLLPVSLQAFFVLHLHPESRLQLSEFQV